MVGLAATNFHAYSAGCSVSSTTPCASSVSVVPQAVCRHLVERLSFPPCHNELGNPGGGPVAMSVEELIALVVRSLPGQDHVGFAVVERLP